MLLKTRGVLALIAVLTLSCQSFGRRGNETPLQTFDNPESSFEREVNNWDSLGGVVPCDPTDRKCGKAYPVAQAAGEFHLFQSDVTPPTMPDENVSISGDVRNLLDANFIDSLNKFDCSSANDVIPTPYFSGIQGLDGVLGVGDSITANFYIRNASAAISDSNALIRHWKLFHYYNRPSVNDVNPYEERTGEGTFIQSVYRENHAKYRYTYRDSGDFVTTWGDQSLARLLGIWAAADGDDFLKHTPKFGGSQIAQDRQDFSDMITEHVQTAEWKKFMYEGAWNVGLAMKCGVPIFMHSGGGSAGAFLVRLLAMTKELHVEKWRPNGKFAMIGLESVLTDGLRKSFQADSVLGGRVLMENYVVGKSEKEFGGSSVWQDTIVKELTTCGFVPLATKGVSGASTSWWDPVEGGHGGIGFYPLRYGRLPNVDFPTP